MSINGKRDKFAQIYRMEVVFESFEHLLNPNWIMKNGGLYLVLVILFVETGIFLGFFLPGDPLLFISGMVIAGASETAFPFNGDILNLTFWMFLFILATLMGYYLGYWIGQKFGHVLQQKKDNWLFKKKHIEAAHQFYEKRGGMAIAISRFLPIVRTFAPLTGGMVRMDLKKFSVYNVLGAIIWVVSITSLGFVLGENAWVKNNLEVIIISLVLVVTAPVIFKMVTKKGKDGLAYKAPEN